MTFAMAVALRPLSLGAESKAAYQNRLRRERAVFNKLVALVSQGVPDILYIEVGHVALQQLNFGPIEE